MRTFLNKENITNLIKENTSFKAVGSFFDLILTILKYSFQYSTSIVIDLSDHHHLIFSMMKGKLAVEEPKRLLYHNFNCFNDDYFEKRLPSKLNLNNKDYTVFEDNFANALNKDTSKKTKSSRLKNKATNTNLPSDKQNY